MVGDRARDRRLGLHRRGTAAAKVPTRRIPSVVLRVAGLFDAKARAAAPDLGYARQASREKARRIIGWDPRPPEDAIVAAGESMIAAGI